MFDWGSPERRVLAAGVAGEAAGGGPACCGIGRRGGGAGAGDGGVEGRREGALVGRSLSPAARPDNDY